MPTPISPHVSEEASARFGKPIEVGDATRSALLSGRDSLIHWTLAATDSLALVLAFAAAEVIFAPPAHEANADAIAPSFGGLGYAASGTKQAVRTVEHVVAPSRPQLVPNTAAQAQYAQPKVTVCHNGHTITISRAALPAHLRRGDTVGACGVAGASAQRFAGGVLGSSASGGTLPFTGISLGVTVLVALMLVSLGLALRRRADRKS